MPRNSVRRVVLVFVLILAVVLPITMLSTGWQGWGPITGATAAVGGACARILGIEATVEGNLIRLPSRSLSIDPGCTAIPLLAIYIALVLAYPVRWSMRLLAIAVGTPLLLAVNIVRLVGVAWASELLAGRSFYMVHDYLFEVGMVFVALMMWAVWLSFARRPA